ncbi:MAG: recombinase family protein [Lachnospiraceae bacterium]|nr:recombinase family protein [Lachnospiraceae bacterium]
MQQGKGRLNTGQFLGYDKDPKDIHKYVIVPEEAETVRRIYREFLEGFSPGAIAAHLTKDQVKTPAGKDTWYQSTVVSILENEKYCGDLLMQKYFITDFLTHKIEKNTGQLPQYFVEDHRAPIVPKEVFYQVQGELQRRSLLKYEPGKIRYGNANALSGRLICGFCGRTLKQYKNPNPAKTEWRCRKRSYET